MIGYFEFILYASIMIIIGIILGQLGKKDIQKNKCPHCACRECCKIGVDVKSTSSETNEVTFACMRK